MAFALWLAALRLQGYVRRAVFGSGSMVRVVLWLARLGSIAAVVPLMLILFGEQGSGPAGAREWLYLALFPVGFSVGYLIGWRWPLLGGCISLACMVTSLLVIGKLFPLRTYLIWGILSVPGVLFVIAGVIGRKSDGAPTPNKSLE
jgi:hypothetical protein